MCKSPSHHNSSSPSLQKNMTTKSSKSRPLLLLLCATGITSCYLYYGIIQERVFDIDNNNKDKVEEGSSKGDADTNSNTKQSITLFLLATGTFSSFLIAWIWTIIGPTILKSDNATTEETKGKLNHPLIILTSLTYLSAMAASNESLHYVSYPTCVLAKSSKLIPTMIVGWLLDTWRSYRNKDTNGKEMSNNNAKSSVNMLEWVGAILITVGILLFQYIQLNKQSSTGSDSVKEDKPDSPYGLALLLILPREQRATPISSKPDSFYANLLGEDIKGRVVCLATSMPPNGLTSLSDTYL